jgi:hypothetical protein
VKGVLGGLRRIGPGRAQTCTTFGTPAGSEASSMSPRPKSSWTVFLAREGPGYVQPKRK